MVTRGCGGRKENGLYATVETSLFGQPIEWFIVDPALPVQQNLNLRAPLMLEDRICNKCGTDLLNPRTPDQICPTCGYSHGTFHLVLGIGAKYYPYLSDFVEECMPAPELIVSEHGLTPISNLKSGDHVLTHKGRFRPISHIFTREYSGNLFEINTYYYSDPLRVTPNHPVLRAKVLRGRKRRAFEGMSGEKILDQSFVCATDLMLGDYIPYPIMTEEHDLNNVTMEYTKTYPEFHGNSIVDAELEEKILSHRRDPNLHLHKNQHTILQFILTHGSVNFATLNSHRAELGYSFDSGLARGLTRLINKGLLSKTDSKKYTLTERGSLVAQHPHDSFNEIAKKFGVSTPVIHRIYNPSKKDHHITTKIPLDEALCSIIGYYLAEGSPADTTERHKEDYYCVTEFSFGKNDLEKKYAEEVVSYAESLGFSAKHSIKQGLHHTVIFSRHMANFLRGNFGHGAHNKKIPFWYRLLPRRKLSYTLRTYLNGDGHEIGYQKIGTTVSPSLAFSLKEIGNKLGYRTSLLNYGSNSGYSVNSSIFRVVFYNQTGSRTFIKGNYIYLPIRKIKKMPYVGTVFNLEVEEDNSFCTPYHTVHNCRVHGVSKRIPVGYNLGSLTPNKSSLILVHARAIPEFTYDLGREFCPRKIAEKPNSGLPHLCVGDTWDLSAVSSTKEKHVVSPLEDNPDWSRVETPSVTYDVMNPLRIDSEGSPLLYRRGIVLKFPCFKFEYVNSEGRAPLQLQETMTSLGYGFKVVDQ